jgi:phosphoenolpyruvate carboxylase
MATQHPDNAGVPYWSKESTAFVDARSEVEEAFLSYSQLGCPEYMWDWEGKHVDEAVVERLFEKHTDYFRSHPLGISEFLTFRVPNPWQESGYKLARAFVNITAASQVARELSMHWPPVFEAILPMTESGRQLHWMRTKYVGLAKALGEVELSASGKRSVHPKDIEWIPLVETTAAMSGASKILSDYVGLCKASRQPVPDYLRPFVARSDPALNSGLVPAVLSAKLCLSQTAKFSSLYNIPTYPIIGVGCLPFRGGLTPEPSSIRSFAQEYPGVYTPTLQSAFRYDYPQKMVKASIPMLSRMLGKNPQEYSQSQHAKLSKLIGVFASQYQKTISKLAPTVNRVAKFVPARRERRLHVGLFGYSRKVGKASLPRAITFTAAMYSLGVPPELVGTGRGIALARKAGALSDLEEAFPTLGLRLRTAGRFLNKENLQLLASSQSAWKPVLEDVTQIESYLGEVLGPVEDEQLLHRNLTSSIRLLVAKNKPAAASEVQRAALLRRSVG